LAGKNDRLIHVADLEKEVLGADVKFKVALKSAHFVTYEQPEAVAQLIETTFERKKGEQII
jgi:pimeloyl-ACP methyl ester carboxylesterase